MLPTQKCKRQTLASINGASKSARVFCVLLHARFLLPSEMRNDPKETLDEHQLTTVMHLVFFGTH